MAAMTVHKIVDAGTAPTFAAVNASDTAAIGNGTNTYLHVKNTGSAAVTVSITDYLTADNGDQMGDHTVIVAATNGEALIPLRRSYDKGDGTGAQIAYTGTLTDVTAALVQVQ